jgi:hypothetical protein
MWRRRWWKISELGTIIFYFDQDSFVIKLPIHQWMPNRQLSEISSLSESDTVSVNKLRFSSAPLREPQAMQAAISFLTKATREGSKVVRSLSF